MIRIILFLISLFIFTPNAMSQNTRISVAAYPQFIWFASDNEKVQTEGLMTSINAGLILDFFFTEKYAFSTGVVFDNLGGRVSFEEELSFGISGTPYLLAAGVELKQKLQYLGIPLGLKLKTQEIGYSTFYVNPGITPMINLRSTAQGGNIPKKSDFSGETKFFNINYFISGGVEYSLGGSTSVFSGLGYSAGFLDISSRPDYKTSTRSLFLTMGILF